MKNKQIKLDKKRVWEYFIKQKILEICLGIVGLLVCIFIPYYSGLFGIYMNWSGLASNEYITVWIFGIVIDGLIIGILYVISHFLIKWIKYNWRKAEDRVWMEMQNEKRK